ncbi:MAG: LCP family protein [Clostridia bacterium]|nr:LCP family protein [Clostridia bacterium]
MQKRKYLVKYIVFFILVISALTLVVLSSAKAEESDPATADPGDAHISVLCLGLDDAAGNTDVVMLLSLDPRDGSLTLLQIPRDTYLGSHTVQSKINQLYPSYLGKGYQKNEALDLVKRELADVLGVDIDYYMAVDLEAVSHIVDSLGGLRVEVPFPVRHRSRDGEGYVEIPAGEQLLGGREAIEFLRFRAGYLEGDLGRVDAQKLLLAAGYRKLKEDIGIVALLRLIPDMYGRLYTDMPLTKGISLARSFLSSKGDHLRLLTLPGEATRADGDRGIWYYVANKPSAEEALDLFFGGRDFDPSGRLFDPDRIHFSNIYYDRSLGYTVYTEETLDNIAVKTKQK